VMRRIQAKRRDGRTNILHRRDQGMVSFDDQLSQVTVVTTGIQHLLVQGNVIEENRSWHQQRPTQLCTAATHSNQAQLKQILLVLGNTHTVIILKMLMWWVQ